MNEPTLRWTQAWVVLCLALALHVVDEAINGFLEVWNPAVMALRERVPWLPFPTFSFGVWLSGLAVAVVALLALTRWVRRGARWMIPLSLGFAVIMFGNGLLHLAASVAGRRLMPGVYSAPVLIGAAGFLARAAWRARAALEPR